MRFFKTHHARKHHRVASQPESALISRREYLKMLSTYATIGTAALMTPVLIDHARSRLVVRAVDIELQNFPKKLDGLRIAHLSDIHLGNTISREDIFEIVKRTNALNPDLIVITGDLVDGLPEILGQDLAPMADFKAPYGTWFVTGNHDHMWDARKWCEILESLHIHVLDNAHELITIRETPLAVCGAIDARGDRKNRSWISNPEKALSGIDPEIFKLMLVHQPASVDRSLAAGADLVLVGHTHGGQCWPLNYLIDAMHTYSRGLYSLNGRAVYVSCGTGYWGPPLRLGIPAEIALLTLHHRTALAA